MDLNRYGIIGKGEPLPHDAIKAELMQGDPFRDERIRRNMSGLPIKKEKGRKMLTQSEVTELRMNAYEVFERSIRELDTRKRPFYSRSTMAKMVQNAIDKLEEDMNIITMKGLIRIDDK